MTKSTILKYLLSCLITISFFSSSAAQLSVRFNPFRISFGGAPTKYCYKLSGTAPCGYHIDSVKAKNNGNCQSGYSKTKPIVPTFPEICNNVDDDCDGTIDDFLPVFTLYQDLDGDKFGNPNTSITTCHDTLTGYVKYTGDCNDANPSIHQGVPEFCDGIDQDCSGDIEVQYKYYMDGNLDGFPESLDNFLYFCEATAPFGFTANDTVPVVGAAFTMRGEMNLGIISIAAETGHVPSATNVFVDWNTSTYMSRFIDLNSTYMSWPGSSWTYSTHHPSGDTIPTGPNRAINELGLLCNGVNGYYRSWPSDPTNPIKKYNTGTPKFNDDSILNDANINDYGVSFFPYAVDFLTKTHSKMIYQTNVSPFSWKETKDALLHLQRKGVYGGIVCAGMELSGRGYNHAKYGYDLKNGADIYVNTALRPLHDSLSVSFPESITIADVDNIPIAGIMSNWNQTVSNAIARDPTYGVRVYMTDDWCLYTESMTYEQIKSIWDARLTLYMNNFVGNYIYIHQWNTEDSLLASYIQQILIEFDADHPNVLLVSTYNGMKNLNMWKRTTAPAFTGLLKTSQLFSSGATTLTATTNNPLLFAVGSKGIDGKLTIQYINKDRITFTINYISVDGFITEVKQTANANSITIIK